MCAGQRLVALVNIGPIDNRIRGNLFHRFHRVRQRRRDFDRSIHRRRGFDLSFSGYGDIDKMQSSQCKAQNTGRGIEGTQYVLSFDVGNSHGGIRAF